jgi:hypothetical protein
MRGFRLSQPVRIAPYAEQMLEVLLKAVLGPRRVGALQTLAACVAAAVMVLVPGAAAAIFRTAIREEQARITPLVEQMVRRQSQHLDHGYLLRLRRDVQQQPHN